MVRPSLSADEPGDRGADEEEIQDLLENRRRIEEEQRAQQEAIDEALMEERRSSIRAHQEDIQQLEAMLVAGEASPLHPGLIYDDVSQRFEAQRETVVGRARPRHTSARVLGA